MRLSEAYERQTDDPALELKIDVVNINPGCNDELLRKSHTLHQYMEFVEKVKRYSEEYPFEEAMTYSVDECIKEDILADFFEKNRAEVLRTSIFVYDQEKHMRQTYEEGVQDGEERGIQIGEKRGEQSLLTKQVSSKVKKGYTLEQTAEALEYPIKELEPIYNMVRESESGYNVSLKVQLADEDNKKE